jgi:hypothetical protein
MPSSNTINYSPGVLTQNTWFKRYVVSSPITDTSAAVAININTPITNNTITNTSQTICLGSIPAPITATTATGGNGTTYKYKWLKSLTGATIGFANAGGNDSVQNFISNALTQTTWYKRRVISGVCNADTTSELSVTVIPTITSNTITGSAQSICSGSIPAPITATIATGGNGTTYNYKWLKSITSVTTGYANAGGNDSIQNFISDALTQTTWFKRKVISGICNVDTTAALLVMAKPIPTTSNISGKTIGAKLDTASYSVNGLSASIFNWVVSGATIQSGAGSNKIQVKWSTSGTQLVKVTETSNQGCIGVQKSLSVTISPTIGLNELKANNQVIIYPNPFSETIHITLLNNLKLEKAIIYDLLGNENINSNKNEIDGSSLKSGIYLIMIVDINGNSYKQKLVKN